MHIQIDIADDDEFDDDLDFDLLDRCQQLEFLIEIGELHERDKYSWSE